MRAPDFSTRAGREAPAGFEAALAAAVLAALVASSYAASSAWADLRRARSAIEVERRQSRALEERARALEVRRRGDALAAQVRLSQEAPPRRVLAALTRLLPEDVRLDAVSFTYADRLRVEARVAARGAAAYDAFLKRISESPLFEEIVPGAESREGELQVSLQLTWRGAGRP